jgi:hypothetical protein
MSRHPLMRVLILVILLSLLIGSPAAAKSPSPDAPKKIPQQAPVISYPSAQLPARVQPQAFQPVTNSLAPGQMGQPGLSYRFVEQWGETEVPYFTDNDHINRPRGLYIDRSTNELYVTEERGGRVIKFDSAGVGVWSFGKPGVTYTGQDALNDPQDVALDKNKNVWVVDGSRVVELDQNGSFLQEWPSTNPWETGSDNDHFNSAIGIAFDSQGKMYISDYWNHRVQVFTFDAGGVPVYERTIGGTQGDGADQFNEPHRIAFDDSDNLYVADSRNNRIQKCTYTAGTDTWSCTTFYNTGLNYPNGVETFGTNTVYIADTDNSRILKCTGTTCVQFPNANSGFWTMDFGIDSLGSVFFAAPWDNAVRKLTSTGIDKGFYVGDPNMPYWSDLNHFYHPRLGVDPEGNIVIGEDGGGRLIKKAPDGTDICSFGTAGIEGDPPYNPGVMSFAFDAESNIYVATWGDVRIYDKNCNYLGLIDHTGSGIPGDDAYCTAGVAVGPDGTVYISDQCRHRIMYYKKVAGQFQYQGIYFGVTDDCGQPADTDKLCDPAGMAVDTAGNLYVAETNNPIVVKISPARQMVLSIGVPGEWGWDFQHLGGEANIAVDSQGRIFVPDWGNNRVDVYDSTGAYLTQIGGEWGSQLGQARAVVSVGVDAGGTVYFTDWTNGRVMKYAQGVPGWRQVNINGFGNPWNYEITRLSVHNNMLYASTDNNNGQGGTVWRSADGRNWQQVSAGGMGNSNINRLHVEQSINGYLYVGTSDPGGGAEMWRCAVCDGTDWQKVVSNGFGNPNNNLIQRVIPYNGAILATVDNVDGLEIWRSATGAEGSWTQVASGGFDDPTNTNLWAVAIYNNSFYGVTWYQEGTGLEVWRCTKCDGTDWEKVADAGFGDSNNLSLWAETFNGKLYVSTFNQVTGDEVWRCTVCDGSDWTQVNEDGFGVPDPAGASLFTYKDTLYATRTDLWATKDGTTWERVMDDHFGDPNNGWLLFGITFKGGFYLSVANSSNGAELWAMFPYRTLLPAVLK